MSSIIPEYEGSHHALGTGPVVLWVPMTAATPAGESPRPLLAAAVSAQGQRIVRTERLADFVKDHARCTIVCHDAGELHWNLVDHLRHTGDTQAEKTLWAFSREGRLIDVTLFEQLLQLARGKPFPTRPQLVDLAQLVDRSIDDALLAPTTVSAPDIREIGANAASIAIVLLMVFEKLDQEADTLIHAHGIEAQGIARYGKLGLSIEVQAKIAAEKAMRNRFEVAGNACPILLDACDRLDQDALRVLGSDRDARQFLRVEAGHLKRSGTGFPVFREQALQDWLRSVVRAMRGIHQLSFTPALVNKKLATVVEEWGDTILCHPSLRAWADLLIASKVRQFAQEAPRGPVGLHFNLLPRLRSWKPDLEAMARLHSSGILQPPQGHHLLVIELADVQLRALASTCLGRFGKSRLAEIFAEETAPDQVVAAALAGVNLVDWGRLLEGQPEEYQRWVEIAKGLLFAVPRGLGPESAAEIIRNKAGVDVPLATARPKQQPKRRGERGQIPENAYVASPRRAPLLLPLPKSCGEHPLAQRRYRPLCRAGRGRG